MNTYVIVFGYTHSHLLGTKEINRDCLVEVGPCSFEEAQEVVEIYFQKQYLRLEEKTQEIVKQYKKGIVFTFDFAGRG